mmetsp:Transcript_121377/g.329575  ORF Transcript_121377/g.329575 Transcript_121377/m.329575 type:complete len:263 (+) Transcript_121377:697-1485(+)
MLALPAIRGALLVRPCQEALAFQRRRCRRRRARRARILTTADKLQGRVVGCQLVEVQGVAAVHLLLHFARTLPDLRAVVLRRPEAQLPETLTVVVAARERPHADEVPTGTAIRVAGLLRPVRGILAGARAHHDHRRRGRGLGRRATVMVGLRAGRTRGLVDLVAVDASRVAAVLLLLRGPPRFPAVVPGLAVEPHLLGLDHAASQPHPQATPLRLLLWPLRLHTLQAAGRHVGAVVLVLRGRRCCGRATSPLPLAAPGLLVR